VDEKIEEIELSSGEKRFAPSSAAPILDVQVDAELERDLARIPDKLAFKIGEVAELLEVRPYVLRYWETEFEVLKPKKSKHNQRMYERKDVENLLLIKKLLYRDRFSIEGARSALKRLKKDNARVKQIRSLAERYEDTSEKLYELLADIRELRGLF
jgi:DNA-binding transcriptional MerR regulator